MPFLGARAALPLWALLYWVAGYISLQLDDPVSQVGFVWLPSGVGVAAFFALPRRLWPWLFALLLAADFSLDVYFQHSLYTSIWVGVISLLSNLGVAWVSQQYARGRDALRAVLGWIVATFLVGLVEAAIGSLGMALATPAPWLNTLWVWWTANVTGVLFTGTILMGFVGFRQIDSAPQWRGRLVALLAWAAMVGLASYVFSLHRPTLATQPLLFLLACLPIALTAVVALAGGNRLGSLALITLGGIVIVNADDGLGPFFLQGLMHGEPLLLAQCYLVSAALLLVFLRLLTQRNPAGLRPGAKAWHHDGHLYRLDLASGELLWDTPPQGPSGPLYLPTLAAVLERVGDADRAALTARLQEGQEASARGAALSFALRDDTGTWTRWTDYNGGTLASPQGGRYLIGSWTQS